MNEPRYTLDEARRELERLECSRFGHDYNIVLAAGLDGPERILCQRCGRRWTVNPEPQPMDKSAA